MALTLVEAAKNSQNPLQSAIIEMYAMNSTVLANLPFENIPGNALRYNREESLPGIGFRGVNESYTESTGVINPQTEPLVIAGGDLDVDKFIIDTMGAEQRSVHEDMKVKALALSWTKAFFKGDSTSDPRSFDGLQARLTGDQLIDAGSTDGGDALSLAKLDELIDTVEMPTGLFMNKAMRRRLTTAARSTSIGGFINYEVDQFGRKLAATSIYCVSFQPGKFIGIQNGQMDVRDLGELQTKPAFRTRVEWFSGLAMFHGKAAARLRGVSNAAVTA